MGSPQSKAEESKEVDSNGAINNNIVLKNTDVVNVSVESEILVLLSIICGFKILEILLFIYYKHRNHLKNKYLNRNDKA